MFADSLYFGEECFPARPCESYDDANDVSSSIRLIRNLDCHFVVTIRAITARWKGNDAMLHVILHFSQSR